MIFAVAMTFIDRTIGAIAVPSLQDDLSLSALFAFGGRLADIFTWRAASAEA
jgi:hypothetical protein